MTAYTISQGNMVYINVMKAKYSYLYFHVCLMGYNIFDGDIIILVDFEVFGSHLSPQKAHG